MDKPPNWSSGTQARAEAWAKIDRELVAQAAAVPFAGTSSRTSSPRTSPASATCGTAARGTTLHVAEVRMTRYIIRRLLWGVLLLVARLGADVRAVPDPADGRPGAAARGPHASPRVIAELRVDLGLNKPLIDQFWLYMKGIVPALRPRLQLLQRRVGQEPDRRPPARDDVADVGAAIIWLVSGCRWGSSRRCAGARARTAPRWAPRCCSSPRPEYWLGLIVLYLFAADIGQLKVFPGAGSYVGLTADPWKWFTSLILPWLVLAAGFAAIYARLMRGSLIETMGEDYIRTARAKGLPERQVVLRHGLRSAITPIMTILAPRHRRAARRGGAGRDRVRHPRDRAAELRRDHPCGLPDHPGHGAARRAVHHRREHRRGHRVRVSRSRGSVTHERPSRSRCCGWRICAWSSRPRTGSCTRSMGSATSCGRGRTLGIVGESGSGKTVASLTCSG